MPEPSTGHAGTTGPVLTTEEEGRPTQRYPTFNSRPGAASQTAYRGHERKPNTRPHRPAGSQLLQGEDLPFGGAVSTKANQTLACLSSVE